MKNEWDNKKTKDFFSSTDVCNTDILVLSCIEKTVNEFLKEDIVSLLHDTVNDAVKQKKFSLQFTRFKLYKDTRIALRATIKGNAKSVDEKIEFLNSSKDILIDSLKDAFQPYGICEKSIVFVVMYQLGDQVGGIKEKTIEKWEKMGKTINPVFIEGYADFTILYNEEKFMVLCPNPRELAYPSAMDLVYDIEEKTFIENGDVVYDLDIIKNGIDNYSEKGLEYQRRLKLIPITNVISIVLFFITGIPLILFFMYQTYISEMPIMTLGGFFLGISFIPIGLNYYRKITSKNILINFR